MAITGTLDTSFNSTGYDTRDVAGDDRTDVFSAVAVQSTGKYIAVGAASPGGVYSGVIYRYVP